VNDGKPGPAPKKGYATGFLLAGLCLAAVAGGVSTDISQLQEMGARKRLFGFHPHPHQLIMPLFLHFGWVHWACNVVSLASLALSLEVLAGPAMVIFLFFFSGVASIMVSLEMNPQVTSLGCSGAVFGMLAARVVHSWWPPQAGDRFRWLIVVLLVAALTFLPTLHLPVDHAAHWGGFVAGVVGYVAWRLGWLTRSLALAALLAWAAWETRQPRLPF